MTDPTSATYTERLTAPASWWVGAAAFAAACGWVVLVATTVEAALGAVVVVLAGLGALVARYGAVTISVDAAGLAVGRSRLGRAHLGDSVPLSRAEYRTLLGPGADVRAYLVTRPYLDRGVRVTVDDPTDPAPYWLVSTRRPDALAAALAAATPVPEASRGEA